MRTGFKSVNRLQEAINNSNTICTVSNRLLKMQFTSSFIFG